MIIKYNSMVKERKYWLMDKNTKELSFKGRNQVKVGSSLLMVIYIQDNLKMILSQGLES